MVFAASAAGAWATGSAGSTAQQRAIDAVAWPVRRRFAGLWFGAAIGVLLGLSAAICVGAALLRFRSASTESVVLPATGFCARSGMRLLFAHGLREVGIDVLWDSLLQVMPRHGQRVADAKSAALALIERQDGLLRLSYEGLGSSFDFDDDPRGRSTVDGGQIDAASGRPAAYRRRCSSGAGGL